MSFGGAWPLAAAALAPLPVLAATAAEPATVGELVVVGSPLTEGVPSERLPAQVRVLDRELDRPGDGAVTEVLVRNLGAVVGVDSLGNALQQTLSLRGFSASPALGEPQGVTVLQGAMRVNEAFGDVVQWDLLPVFAIDRVQVISGSNPVYGLNTTGGVVTLSMKNGFSAPGRQVELSGGSFGRQAGGFEAGGSRGGTAAYLGVDALQEDGWRDHSPGRLARAYLDLAWRPSDDAEVGLGVTAGQSRLTGNGPAPEDLLAQDRAAVFTYPDRTDTSLLAAALRASYRPSRSLSVGGGAFVRRLDRRTANGDQAEFAACEAFDDLDAPDDALCFGAEAGGDDREPRVLVDADGDPITEDDADAVFNRTRTRTLSGGVNGQLTWRAAVAGRENVLVAGFALEQADTRFRSGSELGELQADRGVEGLGLAIGNPEFNVGLKTRSRTAGAYVSDTWSATPRLHLSGALRWNRSTLRLRDQIGTALTGDHAYERLNLGAGVAWNATDAITAYAALTGNSRAPTPAELSCADPAIPCRFPNAFLSDPPLDEVKARTAEAGLRGQGGGLVWSASAFRTELSDDIVFISAGPIVGTGYFDNVARTRREGLEADVEGRVGPLAWSASYAYVRATFRTPLNIQSPDNPGADADGEIHAGSGDRIPGVPEHSFKATARWQATESLELTADFAAASDRMLRGDEAGLTPALEGFAVLGVGATWRRGGVEAWARIENLTDARYETFGLYGDARELGFESPRFISPAAPRTVLAGLRLRF